MKIIKNKWCNLQKIVILALIVVLLTFSIGCGSQSSTPDISTPSNPETSQPKYSAKVQKAIDKCNEGGYEGYAGAMLALGIDEYTSPKADNTSMEYQFYQYVAAMNLLEYRLKDWPIEQRIESAREHIKKISDSFDGPFSEKVAKLKQAITNDQPEIGMDIYELYFAIGAPNDVNTTRTANGTSQQLIYDKQGIYVYLDNGVVTAIQE